MSETFRNQTLGAIVGGNFLAASVLERYGLDFCCGGKRTLDEACSGRHIDVAKVEAELKEMPAQAGAEAGPDTTWDTADLADYIVSRHHGYVRAQLPVISAHLAKIARVHGERHPELHSVASHFAEIASEMQMHMMKEEQVLFPYIRALSKAATAGGPLPPDMFGTVKNPIRMMEAEHQSTGNELDVVRQLTNDFAVPADACTTYRVCFEELEAFDRDMRRHIHLENNILFPKAVALEPVRGSRF